MSMVIQSGHCSTFQTPSIDSHRLAIERVFPVAVLSGDQELGILLLKTGLGMMSSLYIGWTALQ